MSEINWGSILENGLSSAIDGHFDKEAAKVAARVETIKPINAQPQTPTAAVTGTMKQNNIMVGGVAVNTTALIVTGGILTAIAVYAALK